MNPFMKALGGISPAEVIQALADFMEGTNRSIKKLEEENAEINRKLDILLERIGENEPAI